MTQLLESWESDIEREKERLCSELLGVELGDSVLFRDGGQETQIQVEYMSTELGDDDIVFYLSGRCYRKDGLFGKREGQLTIRFKHGITEG